MISISSLEGRMSPAAQAVLDAYKEASDGRYIDGEWVQDHAGQVAAALRAAVDQVECIDPDDNAFAAGYDTALGDILAIATALPLPSGEMSRQILTEISEAL